MRFTERLQRYGGISRIKVREGSVLAGALFVLGEAERGGGGQGGFRGGAVTVGVKGLGDFEELGNRTGAGV